MTLVPRLFVVMVLITVTLATSPPQVMTADLTYTMMTKTGVGNHLVVAETSSVMKQIRQADYARAQLNSGRLQPQRDIGQLNLAKSTTTVEATNVVVSYLSRISVSSGQTYDLILDTGSSNTWVGAHTPFVSSSSTETSKRKFAVKYGSGQVEGIEVVESVSVATNLNVKQSIGIATRSTGFKNVDGILGVGPSELTNSTISGGGTIPTIIDSLFEDDRIPERILGVSFLASTTSSSSNNGRITFGGVDSTSFRNELVWLPRTQTLPASKFWGVDVTFLVGDNIRISNQLAGIVDTGTTLLMVADDVFEAYLEHIPNATVDDEDTGLIEIDVDDLSSVPDFVVKFGDQFEATLTAEEQFFSVDQNKVLGLSTRKRFSFIAKMGSQSGQGLVILGQKFLELYYTGYSSNNGSVGIAISNRKTTDEGEHLSSTLEPSTGISNSASISNLVNSSTTSNTGLGNSTGQGENESLRGSANSKISVVDLIIVTVVTLTMITLS